MKFTKRGLRIIKMVKVLLLSGYGINCEAETANAFTLAGGSPTIVHINDLITGKEKMSDYQILVFPGGFSYGDDTGAGNAYANKIKNNLWEDIKQFISDEKLIIGICNGFQIMTEIGLFPLEGMEYGDEVNFLLPNTTNRYICRWTNLKENNSKCVFTKGIEKVFIPVAHGEGRFFCSEETLAKLKANNQIVFTYCDSEGNPANGNSPENPNGSFADIAAICDKTGRVMGMMPHPERALYSFNRPDYHLIKELARRDGSEIADIDEFNFRIFKNAVEYFK
jgi:phosphoribosylformylglycinamidine synthase subunit PurQ / glutaminase